MTCVMPPEVLRDLEDLGIPYGKVALAEHQDAWEVTAEKLMDVLRQILGEEALAIAHVGSTAIRGIPAKPVLDIAVGVADLSRVESFREDLAANGIRLVGEVNPGQIMGDMKNARGLECVHIHFLPREAEAFTNYLVFRDYLNRSTQEAAVYACLKEQLAARYAEERPQYTEGKKELIKGLLQRARAWRAAQAEP